MSFVEVEVGDVVDIGGVGDGVVLGEEMAVVEESVGWEVKEEGEECVGW